jgi:hypothetical protein
MPRESAWRGYITSRFRSMYASVHRTGSMALILLALLSQGHSLSFRRCCFSRLIYINHCRCLASPLWYQFLFVEIYARHQ